VLVRRSYDADHRSRLRFVSVLTGRKKMDPTALVVWLLIGAVAGWLAGQIMSGGGFGLVGDIIIGIIGACIAGWLFPYLNIRLGGGILGEIIAAAIGAIILLFVLRLVRRA
jgi:uncharacterized membrane protein YeaQ/YmgE (transglycosylase-associated protein family)